MPTRAGSVASVANSTPCPAITAPGAAAYNAAARAGHASRPGRVANQILHQRTDQPDVHARGEQYFQSRRGHAGWVTEQRTHHCCGQQQDPGQWWMHHREVSVRDQAVQQRFGGGEQTPSSYPKKPVKLFARNQGAARRTTPPTRIKTISHPAPARVFGGGYHARRVPWVPPKRTRPPRALTDRNGPISTVRGRRFPLVQVSAKRSPSFSSGSTWKSVLVISVSRP